MIPPIVFVWSKIKMLFVWLNFFDPSASKGFKIGSLFLEFNSKMKLGDQLIYLPNNLKKWRIYHLNSVRISASQNQFQSLYDEIFNMILWVVIPFSVGLRHLLIYYPFNDIKEVTHDVCVDTILCFLWVFVTDIIL